MPDQPRPRSMPARALVIGLCLPMALLLFPDGRPVSPRWRWSIWAVAVEGVLFEANFAGPGTTQFCQYRLSPSLTIPFYDRLTALWTVSNLAYAAILGLAIASLVIRYRRGSEAERRQLLWLVLACLVVFGYAGLWWGLTGTGPIPALLVIPLIPAAITVAILRYQLLDIRLVFSRTVSYAIVTGLLVGVYAGLVLLITQVLRFPAPSRWPPPPSPALPCSRRCDGAPSGWWTGSSTGPLRRRSDDRRVRRPPAGCGGPRYGQRGLDRGGADHTRTRSPDRVDQPAAALTPASPNAPYSGVGQHVPASPL